MVNYLGFATVRQMRLEREKSIGHQLFDVASLSSTAFAGVP